MVSFCIVYGVATLKDTEEVIYERGQTVCLRPRVKDIGARKDALGKILSVLMTRHMCAHTCVLMTLHMCAHTHSTMAHNVSSVRKHT